ncbi:DUF937 domain-containing protein [Deinococcus fonticola]|uniref:DUF937 domain-containing protein n=1 Tax=Deinococcus fonticola TaxID=2528713 RepID=UPI0010756679|nr:DUF937 domain-containing protein [Deinococcus fonticola]
MNTADLIQSYFDGDNALRLGQAVGLDGAQAQQALSLGLPLQVSALADHAAQPQGQAQIMEAIASLPQFGSIAEVLGTADGADNLQRAGELLAPALLGGQAESIVNSVTGQVGGSVASTAGGVQKLLQMALPLLLSLLGRQGVSAASLGSLLGGLRNPRMAERTEGVAGTVAGAAGLAGAVPAAEAISGSVNLPGAGGAGTVNTILDLLKSQFSGSNADKIGGAAGFTGGAAGRAVQGAWPVVLSALVNKGRSDAGAGDLLKMMGQFGNLTDGNGTLNAGMLGDAAEMSRVETQGRGLLGSLFGNADEITGRLGTALGGSGQNAGRLLALLAPLLLSLLGKKTTGMNASALSSLLGGLGGHLSSLLPAGLSGLGALLAGQAAAAPATGQTVAATPAVTTVAATPTPAPRVVEAATPTPRPVTPPPATTATKATTVTAATTEKRGGFPWWWILLPLLLLGGCWLTNQNRTTTPATTTGSASNQAASILVTNPSSDATLPAEPFTMSGTGPANTTLRIEDEGQEVVQATVDADGRWSAELPAPTAGEHTYSVIGGEGVRSEFKVNVTEGATGTDATGGTETGSTDTTGTDSTETGTTDTGSTAAGSGTFAISEPAADATLAAGGFDLKGTGTAGDEVEVFEDGTSLGKVSIGDDGNWTYRVASPAAGAHTYSVKGPDGTELGNVATTVEAATGDASACTRDYTLSITDGQTVSEPFRFGGEGGAGGAKGYTVTVKRGERTIGTKELPLDGACGWSYTSKPGQGAITYEVRPIGDSAAEPLSIVNLTVGN